MIKRAIDLFISIIALAILAPVFLIVGGLILLTMGRPILFSQPRPGQNGKIFVLYKFRTMTSEMDQDGIALADEDRLTRFGHFLRRTSLDEIPQLWNVFKKKASLTKESLA